MKILDRKRTIVLGKWLESFLDPNADDYSYKNLKQTAIKILDINYTFKENDISKILFDYITTTQEWLDTFKQYEKNHDCCSFELLYDFFGSEEVVGDIESLISDEIQSFGGNENEMFWLGEAINEFVLFLNYKVEILPLIFEEMFKSKKNILSLLILKITKI